MSGAAQCMGFRALGREFSRAEERLARAIKSPKVNFDDLYEALIMRLDKIEDLMDEVTPEHSRLISNDLLSEDDELNASDKGSVEEAVLQSSRILVADDDPYVREILQNYLQDMGVGELEIRTSGLEVLQALKSFAPDVIITDWNMAPVTGKELLNTIRAGEAEIDSSTPVIFFTANNDKLSRMQIEHSGADHFLTKPVSPKVLRTTLLRVLSDPFGTLSVRFG
ncbi:MAG: hypothetical protein CBB65_01430 [Hyphomonadaceae bacterium TMED5]|nr:hypothetical protein [Ponticaulis sp.]OUY01129.1 MAG: hypothetical protein CBB65_01430 [Hyphomonadaceae bacterium TMED5]|tara:strand:+ start:140521 stop:141192 length:672 start_codon:yes stop_codon:yes gene_type:complete